MLFLTGSYFVMLIAPPSLGSLPLALLSNKHITSFRNYILNVVEKHHVTRPWPATFTSVLARWRCKTSPAGNFSLLQPHLLHSSNLSDPFSNNIAQSLLGCPLIWGAEWQNPFSRYFTNLVSSLYGYLIEWLPLMNQLTAS